MTRKGIIIWDFVTQAVSYGFGSAFIYTSFSYHMINGSYSTGWFAGSGDSSGAWEMLEAIGHI